MKKHKLTGTALGIVVVGSLALLAILVVGCGKEADKPAEDATTAQETVEFVNVRCPIMDTPIDLAKVPESLIREHKGKKVAFCCTGCPVAWDKLSDAEKDAKLAKVTRPKGD